MNKAQSVENSIIKKFRREIWRPFITAVIEYQLIKEGDVVGVCISGGKDSMLLAKCIQELALHGKYPFRAEYIVMDPGYNAANRQRIIDNAEILGIPITVFETKIFDIVEENAGESPCYLCARMRRGALYSRAQKLGCNKIALGHHFDDVVETVLLSMFYAGQVRTMMPKLHSTNFSGMELIRPLYHVKEKDILRFWRHHEIEFIRCACKVIENNEREDSQSKRQEVKNLIAQLRELHPGIDTNIFASMKNVNLETVVGYHDKDGYHSFLDHYDD